jgi:L-alanine-DL-glutamate epimerase-like enolase superfamily enzyme
VYQYRVFPGSVRYPTGFPGTGDRVDQLVLPDGPYIKDGFVQVTDKPGPGAELNPDVAKAHLAAGEIWWG